MVVRDLEKILFEELGVASSVELKHDSDIPWMNGRVIPVVAIEYNDLDPLEGLG